MRSLHISLIKIFDDSPLVMSAIINDEFSAPEAEDPLYRITMTFANEDWPAVPTQDVNEILDLLGQIYEGLLIERERPHKTGLSCVDGHTVRIKERGVGTSLIP